MKELKPNTQTPPNPFKLLDSLRHSGYDNYYAIADIIDNSIDAEASNIWIEIRHRKGDFEIKIADDGSGMDKKTLSEALKLGSETEKDLESDLGRFGMGLCTAGLSMSRRTSVITKQKEGELLMGISDLDWVKEHGFASYVDKADEEHKEIFNESTKKSVQGTVVIFSKSDKIQNTNVTVFSNSLKKEIGRIFRRFIEAGRKFYVNGDLVAVVDPLMLSEPETHVYSDEEYPIELDSPKGPVVDIIRIRLVLLPDFGQAGNEDRGVNARNQGFYVMRNERELFDAETLGLYSKDPHYNRIRGEICFSGGLDDLMGVHFTKRSLSLSQNLNDKLKELVRSQLSHLRNMADLQRPKSEKEVIHDDSEKLISKKSKLLIKPAPEKTTIKQGERKERGNKEELPRKEEPAERLNRICKFEESHMDKLGPLFYPYMEGSKIIIRWNVDHPFYDKIIVTKKDDKTFVTSIDFLVYSLASSELKSTNDENVSLFESLRSNMSTNLRVLLE